jgi:hypothetical protein
VEDQYILEKWEWTEKDFENMGWHDCPIYALRFDDNVYLDIDYIFKWNDNGAGSSFTFWISPATLIFENPYYLKIDIELDFVNGIEIAGISKIVDNNGAIIWSISTQEGDLLIGAETFKQIIRRPPSLQFGQSISAKERGNVSFLAISEKDYVENKDIVENKKNEHRLFELQRERINLILKNENLDRNQLETKQYLLEKRRINQRIIDIDQLLKGTRFEN